MPLSWNEIRHRAIAFSKQWERVESERAEKQTFWNEFFSVFGIQRRAVASFEEPVKKLSGDYSYIDLFWPRQVLVEHKSRGKDLGRAESQAFRYIQDLIADRRIAEVPRYIIVSDFARIALHDLEPDDQRRLPLLDTSRIHTIEFPLNDLHKHVNAFAFIPGYKQYKFEEQDPINIEAVEILGRLHDALEAGGYSGHQLERFLVRILFCLFAEDTGIFERESFRLYLQNRTSPDGSDLGLHLARLFEVLNTPEGDRQKTLDETLAAFPYVNGDLFAERLAFADFNREMHLALSYCTSFDWSRISPAIFGSLFQAVMEPKERRQIGGHYTNERDILKVVRSLFLDGLRAEFERIKRTRNKAELRRFHERIADLRFLDPACGCGNFLVITYRELRALEIEVLQGLFPEAHPELDVKRLSLIDVDAFYGIEISEWPVRIAEVAMWLMDHQMNIRLSETFGQRVVRLPLKKSPHIVHANALRLDWKTVLPPSQCSFILGNPPFAGSRFQSDEQRADMDLVAAGVENSGLLDYVTGWYFKAADYMKGTQVASAFVSTNSITQGEQVGVLWNHLFQRHQVKIHFGHRTFEWESEARGKAHVHVVIVGFACFDTKAKVIYDYDPDSEHPVVTKPDNISPYLVQGPDKAITNRTAPISSVPPIRFGNQPIDGGNLILNPEEKAQLLTQTPAARKYVRLFLGSQEFINGEERWCLWLRGASPAELRGIPEIMRRIEAVRKFRLESKRPATRELASTPTQFAFVTHPENDYLLIPSVSSERRLYAPMGFVPRHVIASNLCLIIPDAAMFHFGVLSSAMHMAWMRHVCGRLKSDYRYSNKLVYNNFPWPERPNDRQHAAIEDAAQSVLDARKRFSGSSLADLYDPLAMPPALAKAHAALDRAVDLCYRPQPFLNDRQRVEYLFALHEKLTAPLVAPRKKKRKKPN